MNTTILPVILAGGVGTRLWPVSRRSIPKQFTALHSDKSMLQETVDRLAALDNAVGPIIVTGSPQASMVREQAPQSTLIVEPVGRNTAPAAALAALYATAQGADPIMLVCPADHVIRDLDAYRDAVMAALPHADVGRLVTFGVVPTAPETGYGYIEKGPALEGAYRVAQFGGTCGTAACSYSGHHASWRNSGSIGQTCWPMSAARPHEAHAKTGRSKSMRSHSPR